MNPIGHGDVMITPNCRPGEYLRMDHDGGFICARIGATIMQHTSDDVCINKEVLGIAGIAAFILLCCAMAAISYGVKRRPKADLLFHDACRHEHPHNEPCQFTDAQKELLRKHGNPQAFEWAIINAIGEISIADAQNAIEKYRRQWDEVGENYAR